MSYETLWDAGRRYDIANAGYRAIDSARLEKGYLYWSSDISPDYNPFEAGLGFCVALEKGEFLGREALRRIKAEGRTRALVSFTVEGFAPLHGGEAIVHEGRVVASSTSAGYGHTSLKDSRSPSGYLPSIALAPGRPRVRRSKPSARAYAARRGPRCLYDPRMERLRS